MSRCDAIRAHAVALSALPEGDPEREAAVAHAAGCADCTAALRESVALLSALDELPPEAPPSPDALARARAAVLLQLEQAAAREPAWRRALVPAQLVALFLVSVLHRPETFPASSWAEGFGLLAASVGLSLLAPCAAPPSPLPPSRSPPSPQRSSAAPASSTPGTA
jgi:hypothetical protein